MSNLPETYKRATFKEAGGPLTIESVNMELPAKGQILAKVEACGVCHSDIFAQKNAYGAGFPRVPGHEVIGHVAAVGEDVQGWKVGDRIGGPWHGGHDGTCKACQKGLFQMCDNEAINGITRDGGYGQYCTLRAEAAVRIPTNVDAAEYAPILCAGVTVFNSMRNMRVPPGSTVAIQGLGGLGHLALQYANKFGYRVVALSRHGKKEKFARELGAHEYIDESKAGDLGEALQRLGGADMIVVTAPGKQSLTPLLKGLGCLGKLLILGVPGEVPLDTIPMIRYGLSVHAWPSGHAMDSEDAIAFTELEHINCMVERFPLEKANEAFDAMLKGIVRFRAVITMD
ncbi:hypothetical protein AJ80_02756 [Polytolypa hystricis UAMH7299]|uniref:Enoyl reductase (ER) domain-containing protein n=1 Tax=Polytolypa hystricis (strain UAMH7299) TaxID=1447883 RepID=A0A2B7YR70_POLH7|nr:hypothetical protein AJ80_02756 [Polytolypa hystricis UAMH7299]